MAIMRTRGIGLGTLVLSVCHGAASLAQAPPSDDKFVGTLFRLSLNAPSEVINHHPVRKPLEELTREPCDQEAIVGLGKALQGAGYRREAALAHVQFSKTCNGHAPSLRTAINIVLNLSDATTAANIATELIKLEPFKDNGYYLRALAHDRLGQSKKAIDDYATAIELFGAKDRIASASYEGMARNHEKLGQPCDAVRAIETWVAINPARNDNSQSRTMISKYLAQGNCAQPASGTEDTFPIVRQNNVVTLPVTINGVRGTFVLDTGATWVSLKRSFAEKAKVEIDEDSSLQLHTANGIAEAKRGRAKTIQLKILKSTDVPLIVQADVKGAYGPGIDGLLGMSFLSRYNVSFEGGAVKIRARTGR